MADKKQKRPVFFLSDRTGITSETLGHALLTQFSAVEFDLRDEGATSVLEIRTVEDDAGDRFWRFGISLQDDLMRRFGGALGLMDRALGGLGDDSVPLESKTVSRTIERAQSQAEAQYFEIRKDVLKYDDVLNAQREVIYKRTNGNSVFTWNIMPIGAELAP